MEREKISIAFEFDDEYQVEQLWAKKEGKYYRIDSIPFFVYNLALNDLIKVEDDEGELFFDELVEPSGHSVIQIIFFKTEFLEDATTHLENLGCAWEQSAVESLIAVDVPPNVKYSEVSNYLDTLSSKDILDYKEACLGFKPLNP